MKKVFTILYVLFLTQFFISCFADNCGGGGGKFEVTYNGLEINPAKVIEGRPYEVLRSNGAYKTAFGLEIIMEFDLKQVGMLLPNSYGFTSTLACSPVLPHYTRLNPIASFDIFVIDTQTDEKTKITSFFVIRDYSSDYSSYEWISIKEFFEKVRPSYYNQSYDAPFFFKLNQYDSIPKNSIFTVEAHLESGQIVSHSSKSIHFHD
jgi:hypothetical protein